MWKTELADAVTEVMDGVRPMIDAHAERAHAPRMPGRQVVDVMAVVHEASCMPMHLVQALEEVTDAPRMGSWQLVDAPHDVAD